MQEVDAVIRRRLASEVVLIDQISKYIIGAGGKRIRPLLVLLFFVTISSFPAAPIGLIERITAAAQALWPLAVVLSAAPRR